MKEKFSNYEGTSYLGEAGTFTFEVVGYELKPNKNGDANNAIFEVKCNKGSTTLYKSLKPNARWSYNKFIRACLGSAVVDDPEYMIDYETIGNELIGCLFVGVVEADTYTKEVKVPLGDGTFDTVLEEKTSYKITDVSEIG